MKWIKKQWEKWISRRFKLETRKKLAQRDVLVFFSREGYLYLVLIIITFIAGINYANNLVLGLCFLLSSILVLSFYLAFRQLYGLTVESEVMELGQVGHPLTIKFTFQPSASNLHLNLRIEYLHQAKKISVLKSPLVVAFEDMPHQRGRYPVAPLYFYSVYPFGIIRAWSYAYLQKEVWIAPEPLELNLTKMGFNQNQQDQKTGMEDFSHLREYQQGDALNRVAWQQLAKGRGLLVKQFEEYEQQHRHFDYSDMPAHLHEEKLSQLMFLIEQAHVQHMGFSLKLPTQQLAFGQGEQHLADAKMLLAQEP